MLYSYLWKIVVYGTINLCGFYYFVCNFNSENTVNEEDKYIFIRLFEKGMYRISESDTALACGSENGIFLQVFYGTVVVMFERWTVDCCRSSKEIT